MKRTAVISGGGTGGHIYPGIAIARALQAMDSELDVHFVGSVSGLENKIVPREGLPLHILPIGKLNYSGGVVGKIKTLLMLPLVFLKSVFLLMKLRPKFVLGVGGYASGPFVLVAKFLGFKTAIWEPNAYPGMTNRWLSRFVKTSYVVFSEAGERLNSKRKIQVGLPVRGEIEKAFADQVVNEDQNELHVLVFGGSQGARAINNILKMSAIKEMPWLQKVKVIHQTGPADYPFVKAEYKRSVFNLEVYEYLFDMPKYYQWADLVICRAGASTVAELAAMGKPAVLIPLPDSADDHQLRNARVVEGHGGGIVIEQKDLTLESLNEVMLGLQENREQLKQMSLGIKKLYHPNAATLIARDLMEL